MGKSIRIAYGEALKELAAVNDKIVVCDADLAHATMTNIFSAEYPDRFFNFGIAECNMVAEATGMAHSGLIPFVSTFALFGAGRAFEIIRNGVCYSRLNVKIVGSHGGITAAGDGGSHQCVEDIGIMRSLPNMVVLQPCDSNQARLIAKMAYEHNGPVYIRTSREPMENITSLDDKIQFGKAQILSEGKDLCIVASGMMTCLAHQALDILKQEGVSATLVNIHTIKPFDKEGVIAAVRKAGKRVLVCEESNMVCGLTEAVASSLEAYGITKENIARKAMELIRR